MRKIISAFALALFFLTSPLHGGQPEFTIKVTYVPGHMDPEESPDIMCGYVFKRECEARSNGRIQVDIYGSSQLGTMGEVLQGTMAGYIETTITDNTMYNQHLPMSQVLSVPGIFSTMDEVDEVLNGTEWGKEYVVQIREKLGVRILNHYCKGFRHFTTTNTPLQKVEDARGISFRVMESPVSIRMVEAIGAKAMPLPSSEVYMALRNGVVDGQENPISSFIQDKNYEVQKFMVLDGHIAGIASFIMNEEYYQSLPDDLKRVVDEAAALSSREATRVARRLDVDGVGFLREKGLTVYQPTPEELEDWHRVVSGPTQEYVRSVLTGGELDALLQAIQQVRESK